MPEAKKEMSCKDKVNDFRKQLKAAGAYLLKVKKEKIEAPVAEDENKSEVLANLTLAYRHIEDASMRMGKVLQHLNGGVSIYDKNVVGSPKEKETPGGAIADDNSVSLYTVIKPVEYPRGVHREIGYTLELTDEQASGFVSGLIEKQEKTEEKIEQEADENQEIVNDQVAEDEADEEEADEEEADEEEAGEDKKKDPVA